MNRLMRLGFRSVISGGGMGISFAGEILIEGGRGISSAFDILMEGGVEVRLVCLSFLSPISGRRGESSTTPYLRD